MLQVVDYKQKLFNLAFEILHKQHPLLAMANQIIQNEDFNNWTASCHSHHWGKGGLLRHTYEVCDLCLINKRALYTSDDVDERALFLAALFHDVGKIKDYQYDELTQEWSATEHKFEIHHISTSLLEFDRRFVKIEENLLKENQIPKEFGDNIRHAILAHHGRKEWGSPVNPRNRTAWLLHLCDSISARMDDCGKKPIKKHE